MRTSLVNIAARFVKCVCSGTPVTTPVSCSGTPVLSPGTPVLRVLLETRKVIVVTRPDVQRLEVTSELHGSSQIDELRYTVMLTAVSL